MPIVAAWPATVIHSADVCAMTKYAQIVYSHLRRNNKLLAGT